MTAGAYGFCTTCPRTRHRNNARNGARSNLSTKWGEGSRLVRSARPDMTGLFEIKFVPPGDYLVAPVDYAQTGAWDDPEFLKALQDTATKITVKEGAPASVSLTLRRTQ